MLSKACPGFAWNIVSSCKRDLHLKQILIIKAVFGQFFLFLLISTCTTKILPAHVLWDTYTCLKMNVFTRKLHYHIISCFTFASLIDATNLFHAWSKWMSLREATSRISQRLEIMESAPCWDETSLSQIVAVSFQVYFYNALATWRNWNMLFLALQSSPCPICRTKVYQDSGLVLDMSNEHWFFFSKFNQSLYVFRQNRTVNKCYYL